MRGLPSLLTRGLAGAVLLALPALASAGDLTLEVSGDCPGQLTLRWSGAEPNRQMAIFFAQSLGPFRIPAIGRCEGTWLDIRVGANGRLVRVIRTGSNGAGSVSGYAAPESCGGYLQLMVLNDSYVCQTSNVVQIPD